MQNKIVPTYFYVSPTSIRFAFNEEISFENWQVIVEFQQFIEQCQLPNFLECVPSYHTILVFFKEETKIDMEQLLLRWKLYEKGETEKESKIVTIPVCYDEEFALDMERIMYYTKLSYDEIVKIHSETIYNVFLVGFLPGFPYLGILDKKLHVPRLKVPRKQIAAGTVGIGGAQTGVYPIDSPGGWNIIGKTPVKIFNVDREQPFLVEPNWKVQIKKITKAEFDEIKRNGFL